MYVSDWIKLLISKENYSYYLNDQITDLAELYDNNSVLCGFEFENEDVIRLYTA